MVITLFTFLFQKLLIIWQNLQNIFYNAFSIIIFLNFSTSSVLILVTKHQRILMWNDLGMGTEEIDESEFLSGGYIIAVAIAVPL